ncbi:hypothetical protein CEXT_515861 [Caerostris extrusa]|uniref:Uncharacterized protein n=1 Tax=Caerostris extrusa TaxID=172846 RepID=A0AAV4UUJ3_CAEEX|nr:hypothetical protein CEXT_515861 [Caerostris extrusa]
MESGFPRRPQNEIRRQNRPHSDGCTASIWRRFIGCDDKPSERKHSIKHESENNTSPNSNQNHSVKAISNFDSEEVALGCEQKIELAKAIITTRTDSWRLKTRLLCRGFKRSKLRPIFSRIVKEYHFDQMTFNTTFSETSGEPKFFILYQTGDYRFKNESGVSGQSGPATFLSLYNASSEEGSCLPAAWKQAQGLKFRD